MIWRFYCGSWDIWEVTNDILNTVRVTGFFLNCSIILSTENITASNILWLMINGKGFLINNRYINIFQSGFLYILMVLDKRNLKNAHFIGSGISCALQDNKTLFSHCRCLKVLTYFNLNLNKIACCQEILSNKCYKLNKMPLNILEGIFNIYFIF